MSNKKETSPATASEHPRICVKCGHTEIQHMHFSDHDECSGDECECNRFFPRKPDSASTGKDAKTKLEQIRDLLAEVWQEGYEAGKSATPFGGGEKWWYEQTADGDWSIGVGNRGFALVHDDFTAKSIADAHNATLQPQSDDTKRLDVVEALHLSVRHSEFGGMFEGKPMREAIDAIIKHFPKAIAVAMRKKAK